MKVLGVDPGLRITGYGLIQVSPSKNALPKMDVIEAGVVRTNERSGIAERLRKIYASLSELVEETRPDVLVIEKLYSHYAHPATAILMGHARGAVCLVAGTHGVPLESLASTSVKKTVTGHGHAGKAQMQQMVRHLLGLRKVPEPADVADALAVAITYASQWRGKKP